MASKIGIMNGALQALGARRVESLTQDHPNARSMNAAFDGVRDALLRSYDWGFAIKRASIAADGSQTTWGQWNRYSLPNDFIKLILDDETGQRVDWRIEGRYIITADAAPLNIRYISKVEDPNLFDPLFVEAFEAKLAFETCEEITQSKSKKDGLSKDYEHAINEAKRTGAIERRTDDFPDDDWINSMR